MKKFKTKVICNLTLLGGLVVGVSSAEANYFYFTPTCANATGSGVTVAGMGLVDTSLGAGYQDFGPGYPLTAGSSRTGTSHVITSGTPGTYPQAGSTYNVIAWSSAGSQ